MARVSRSKKEAKTQKLWSTLVRKEDRNRSAFVLFFLLSFSWTVSIWRLAVLAAACDRAKSNVSCGPPR